MRRLAVLVELLPVIGGEDDRRPILQPESAEPLQELSDRLVGGEEILVVQLDDVLEDHRIPAVLPRSETALEESIGLFEAVPLAEAASDLRDRIVGSVNVHVVEVEEE